MTWYIEVRHEDDLLTVVDRVLSASDDDVVLSIPEGARILASEENFALLKREAEAAGKRIAVQTSDPRGRVLVGRAGLALLSGDGGAPAGRRVFSDIIPPSARRRREVSVRAEAAEPERLAVRSSEAPPEQREERIEEVSAQGPEREAAEEVLPIPEPETVGTPSPPSGRRLPPILRSRRAVEIGVILVGVLIAFLVANEVLPHLEVRIHPRSESVAFTLPVTVSVDGGKGTVRGQKLSVSEKEERSIPASGSADVATKASGTITISNAFSSAPQTLVASTRFLSQDGKLFRLQETIVVPGAIVENGKITPSSIEARVVADEAGPEYNIGPSSFSIPGFQGTPKYTAFTARSTAPMTGGARGTVKVVTQQDIDRATEGLAAALSEKLKAKLRAEMPEGLTLLDDAAVETSTITTEPDRPNAPSDAVIGRAEGTRSAIAYADEDLRSLVMEALSERIPEGTEIIEESVSMKPTVRSRDLEKGQLRLDVAVEARAAWKVDVEAVRRAILGKREGEVRGWLAEQQGIESTQVRFTPFWLSSAPTKPDRIEIIVEH